MIKRTPRLSKGQTLLKQSQDELSDFFFTDNKAIHSHREMVVTYSLMLAMIKLTEQLKKKEP